MPSHCNSICARCKYSSLVHKKNWKKKNSRWINSWIALRHVVSSIYFLFAAPTANCPWLLQISSHISGPKLVHNCTKISLWQHRKRHQQATQKKKINFRRENTRGIETFKWQIEDEAMNQVTDITLKENHNSSGKALP